MAKGTKCNPDGTSGGADGVITIKKYANRRLYNTATSSYVTLDHLCQMVKDGEDFVVYDAKSGEDITRSVLTQIIVEEESKGQNLLPISFLKQLIGFYGDSLQSVVPAYLENAMSAFSRNQDETRTYMQDAVGGMFPFAQFDDMAKQNAAMVENAMQMFSGGAEQTGATQDKAADPGPAEAKQEAPQAKPASPADPFGMLQQQVDMLQKQLNTLSGGPNDK